MQVFNAPDLERWSPEHFIYREYSHDGFRDVDGSEMNFAASAADYSVRVGGDGICRVTALFSNKLSCQLPDEPKKNSSFMRGNGHSVELRVGNLNFHVGYVEYYHRWIDDPANRAIVISVVVIFVIIALLVLAYVLVRKFYMDPIQAVRERLSRRRESKTELNPYDTRPRMLMDILQQTNPDLYENVKSCLIEPHTRMRVGQEIGKGNFGKVFAGLFLVTGELKPRDCAIKTLKGES